MHIPNIPSAVIAVHTKTHLIRFISVLQISGPDFIAIASLRRSVGAKVAAPAARAVAAAAAAEGAPWTA